MQAEQYVDQFRDFTSRTNGVPEWVEKARVAGIEQFEKLGFPSTRVEEWKYTSLKPLLQHDFDWQTSAPDSGELERLRALIPPRYDDPRLVFVNGVLVPELGALDEVPNGVIIGSLAEALRDRADLSERMGSLISLDDHPFAALNTAFLRDGAFVYVPARVHAKKTVHLVFISTPRSHHVHPRNLIVVEEEAALNVVEAYVGDGTEGSYFNNVVTEVVTGSNSNVRHYKVQNESHQGFHIANTQVAVGRDSRYASSSVSLGAAICRNDLGVVMRYKGAECVLDGLYLASDEQHVDNHTYLDHAVPQCSSEELYKGVLMDQGRGVFDGRILVREKAQKTNAQQHNKNLLLSRHAVADSKPQLEIFADDVKCAHGTAIGQLDDDAIYYLRARGIGQDDARGLMTHAFAAEVVDRMKLQCTRDWVDSLLWERIPYGERIRPDENDARICLPSMKTASE